jgi:tetratricopeptide (TPR) repeat protein
MTTQNDPAQKKLFVGSFLPWLIAAATFAIYLLTLNSWVSLNNLAQVAKTSGWAWGPELFTPLYYVLTYPIRWLPIGSVPLALNVFSTVCGVLTVALLARSVTLLPHDRTEAQRQRERSKSGLLSIRLAWIPPVLAAAVLALQLSFWEGATSGSSEILDLLVMAYVIRCLLEFRVGKKDSWLYRAAFVCALGMANGWLLFCLVPGFLISLVWIKGLEFFNLRFLFKMTLCGGAGALLYLLLPLIYVSTPDSVGSFWQALKVNVGSEKSTMMMLLTRVPKNYLLLLALPSVLPILVIGIRWASNFGDPSRMGSWLAAWIFHGAHLALLGVCIWVAFDPDFSARQKGFTFIAPYYLGALSVGYFAGYFLLVFDPLPDHMGRITALQTWLHRVSYFAVCVLAVVVPLGLVGKNFRHIRMTNGPAMKEYASLLTQNLPEHCVVLNDNEDPRNALSRRLFLAQAYLAGEGKAKDHLFLDTGLLKAPAYHGIQQKRHPNEWPVEIDPRGTTPVEDNTLCNLVIGLSQKRPIAYLHSSFGYYFEYFYGIQHGMSQTLKLYPTNCLSVPAISEKEIAANESFWSEHRKNIERLAPFVAPPPPTARPGFKEKLLKKLHIPFERNPTALVLGVFYSQALNTWGVELQRAGKLAEAGRHFETAVAVNPDNIAAKANIEANRQLQAGQVPVLRIPRTLEDELGKFRSLQQSLLETGPFDDPTHCFGQAMVFAAGNLSRQAAQQFERIHHLAPDSLPVRIMLARLYIVNHFPDKALDLVSGKNLQAEDLASAGINPLELLQTEATALFAAKRPLEAEQLLQKAMEKSPHDQMLLAGVVQISAAFRRYTNALIAVDRQLQINPDDTAVLVNKGLFNMQTGNFREAIPPLTRAINLQTNNYNALLYRAVACLSADRLDEALRDYECLQKLFPDSLEVNLGLAEVAYQRKETNNAVRYYQLCLAHAPQGSEQAKSIEERLKILQPAP